MDELIVLDESEKPELEADSDEEAVECGLCGADVALQGDPEAPLQILEHYAEAHEGRWPPDPDAGGGAA